MKDVCVVCTTQELQIIKSYRKRGKKYFCSVNNDQISKDKNWVQQLEDSCVDTEIDCCDIFTIYHHFVHSANQPPKKKRRRRRLQWTR